MLHIFWTIVKIPLFLLALLLLILLLLLLLILFVPVRYEGRIVKEDSFSADVRVHWLLRALSVRLQLQEGEPRFAVRILGRLIAGNAGEQAESLEPEHAGSEPEHAGSEPEHSEPEHAGSEPGHPEPEHSEPEHVGSEPEHPEPEYSMPEQMECRKSEDPDQKGPELPENEKTETLEAKPSEPEEEEARGRGPGFSAKIRGSFGKLRNAIAGFMEKLRHIRDSVQTLKNRLASWRDLWYDEHTQSCVGKLKREICFLLRHYLPKKPQGRVLFGLQDPAATGQILGVLYVLQAFTDNNGLEIRADFERQVLETDLNIKGKIRICHVVRSGLSLLLSKDCRITFGRVRSMRA